MERISELIKEAKPLYYERKRNVQRLKAGFAACFLFLALGSPFLLEKFNSGEEAFISYGSDSVIEEMGLPVDEYGLLKVN